MPDKSILSTSKLVKKYGLDAKKSLGQNFIFDSNLTDKIAKSALSKGSNDFSEDVILEIGPGPGGLTKSILKLNPKKLIVVEQDQRCIAALEEIKSFYPDKLEIVKGDALKINEAELLLPFLKNSDSKNNNSKFKIIANLPYNIGTELLFKWLDIYQNIESMTLMFQKEVAQRIVAAPNSKKYGRLAVMVNFVCDTEYLFDVSPSSFTPAPKVTSAMVHVQPKLKPIMDVDLKILSKIVAAAFNQRRKMIRSSLKAAGSTDLESWLKNCEIDGELRAENLTLEQFGKLCFHLTK